MQYFNVSRQKVAYFNVSGQKVTYFNEGEERERGKRKRKNKEEKERGKRNPSPPFYGEPDRKNTVFFDDRPNLIPYTLYLGYKWTKGDFPNSKEFARHSGSVLKMW